MKVLQCIENDVAVNVNEVKRIVHCALNIESAQPVAILTFESTSLVTKNKITMQFYVVCIKMQGL